MASKKKLYLSKTFTLAELNKLVDETATKNKNSDPKIILKTSDRLYDEALKSVNDKDEERAYVLYMRFLDCYTTIKNSPEFRKDPTYYSKMMSSKKAASAVEMSVKLSDSLAARYALMTEAKKCDLDSQSKEMADALANEAMRNNVNVVGSKTKRNSGSLGGIVNGVIKPSIEDNNNITSKQLHNLKDQKSTRFLVIDCRSHNDFVRAHIDHSNCISIPDDWLRPGMSANKIEQMLKSHTPESYMDWVKRGDFHRIILYDWNSSFENQQANLSTMYTAMTEWDPDTKYKCKPSILKGGMRGLYFDYPLLITKPQNADEDYKKIESDRDLPKKLETIEYPNLDDEDTRSKSRSRSNSPSAKPININSNSDVALKNVSNNNSIPKPTSTPPVSFDRTTKPSIPAKPKPSDPVANGPVNHVSTPSLKLVNGVSSNSSTKEAEPTRPIPIEKPSSTVAGPLISTKPAEPTKPIPIVKPSSATGPLISTKPAEPTKPIPIVKPPSSTGPLISTKPAEPTKPIPIVKPSSAAGPLLRPMSQDASPMSYQKLREDSASDLESPRSSLMKRSHSHPNLSQSLAEEDAFEEPMSASTPKFNRNLKPASIRGGETFTPSRTREFHAVNSTEKYATGLKNLGNTCYMNSIMQCINHLQTLVEYLVSETYKDHLKRDRVTTKGDISAELAAALKVMNYGHRSIALSDFKNVVGRYHPSFKGYEQQDSHEFLTILLDWLHEELNLVMIKTPFKEQKNDGLSDVDASEKAYLDYRTSNNSRISDLFCGQQKSIVKCQICGKESVTFEPFFILSVPIPTTSKRVDIQNCIDLYTSEEEVSGWNCVYCKSKGKATKKIDLWRLPPYLIIHLQRFYNDGWWKKRLTEVDFPLDNLDLTSRIKSRGLNQDTRTQRLNFQLNGVSNHYGTMDGGHYTAYCRKGSQWRKFDDNEVYPIIARDVITPAAYILFYSNYSP